MWCCWISLDRNPRLLRKRGLELASECGRITGNPSLTDKGRVADNPSGISVSLQVEYKQFIGNVHLLGSSLR
jgi:hypothetical protein